MNYLVVLCGLLVSATLLAQSEVDVIINEIANSGTKRAMYTEGEYVELLVVKGEGVKLGGWYLSDLSSPTGTAKENEGSIKFSDNDGSVFQNIIPSGTYILICLGKKDETYGTVVQQEDISLSDGNNRIVIFAYASPQHVTPGEGTMQFTGKDNVVLASAWKKDAAVSAVTWGGSSSWTGCKAAELPLDALENGKIASFVPKDKAELTNTDPTNWVNTSAAGKATPGSKNNGVE